MINLRALKIGKNFGYTILLASVLPRFAQAQTNEDWINSRSLLNETQSPQPAESRPLITFLYTAMTKSLTNPEQHRQLLDLQGKVGNKALDGRLRSLSILPLTGNDQASATGAVGRSISNNFGREFKGLAIPQALQKGFDFNFGTKSAEAVAPTAKNVRYGLVLTDIEPHPEPFRLASLPSTTLDEYALVPYAPKAQLKYTVGPLPSDGQNVARSEIASPHPATDSVLSQITDVQFRGKIGSRASSTPGQVLPSQVLTLEETKGFYSFELQTKQIVHKEQMVHRFRLPLMGNMNYRDERNDKFNRTRSTLENIYSNGPLALNLDYFGQDKRYQTGLIYQLAQTRIEFNNHLPQNISPEVDLWRAQRWELKLLTAF